LKLLFPVVLAELSTGEADFAGNHGVMSRQATESSGLKLSI